MLLKILYIPFSQLFGGEYQIQRGEDIYLKVHSAQGRWDGTGNGLRLEAKFPKGVASTFSITSLAPQSPTSLASPHHAPKAALKVTSDLMSLSLLDIFFLHPDLSAVLTCFQQEV